jgi:hypothetical protein
MMQPTRGAKWCRKMEDIQKRMEKGKMENETVGEGPRIDARFTERREEKNKS